MKKTQRSRKKLAQAPVEAIERFDANVQDAALQRAERKPNTAKILGMSSSQYRTLQERLKKLGPPPRAPELPTSFLNDAMGTAAYQGLASTMTKSAVEDWAVKLSANLAEFREFKVVDVHMIRALARLGLWFVWQSVRERKK